MRSAKIYNFQNRVDSRIDIINFFFKTFFKKFANNGKPQLRIAVSGGQVVENLRLALSEIEKEHDVKIVAVTSPKLFEELEERDPAKAEKIWGYYDRTYGTTLHNGEPEFLQSFLLRPGAKKRMIGIDNFLHSGREDEMYAQAGLDPKGIAEKLLKR